MGSLLARWLNASHVLNDAFGRAADHSMDEEYEGWAMGGSSSRAQIHVLERIASMSDRRLVRNWTIKVASQKNETKVKLCGRFLFLKDALP